MSVDTCDSSMRNFMKVKDAMNIDVITCKPDDPVSIIVICSRITT